MEKAANIRAWKKTFVLLVFGLSSLLSISYVFAQDVWPDPELLLFTASSSVLPSNVPETDPPTGSVSINNGALYTNSKNVDLFYSADDDTGIDGLTVRNVGQDWVRQDYFTGGVDWALQSGTGVKVVEVKYFDPNGNESEVYSDDIFLDTNAPLGNIVIENGAPNTKKTSVTIKVGASDGAGSGLDKMRFRNDGGSWSAWQNYATTKSWILTSPNETKKVWAEFKDKAGNPSPAVFDTIFLDTVKPTASVSPPSISTGVSKTTTFKVGWSGSDPVPSSGIASYDVRYKISADGAWILWKSGTTAKAAYFKGKPGKTYYFEARAKDKAGNIGDWSAAKKTIIPHDNNSLIYKRSGFGLTSGNASSPFYLGTIRYSTIKDHTLVYKFTGKSVSLITTKAKNRSKAKIYIDGKYIKTVDAYSSTFKPRQSILSKTWIRVRIHTIKIVNLGTPGRKRFDVDGLAIWQ